MGNDGGTIIKGQRTASKTTEGPKERDEDYQRLVTCSILLLPLINEPVLADRDGRLYLKHKLLEAILEKKTKVKFKHTRPVTITWSDTGDKPRIKCPVTGDTLCNTFGSLSCGCVISTKAIEALKPITACPVCNEAVSGDILLLGQKHKRQTQGKAYKVTKSKKI